MLEKNVPMKVVEMYVKETFGDSQRALDKCFEWIVNKNSCEKKEINNKNNIKKINSHDQQQRTASSSSSFDLLEGVSKEQAQKIHGMINFIKNFFTYAQAHTNTQHKNIRK